MRCDNDIFKEKKMQTIYRIGSQQLNRQVVIELLAGYALSH
ncbi:MULTISPECIES: hypothetical protein [unclassified Methylotenera]|nr:MULTISPECIES: hypothetical protein [unclassified Methylotenera]